MGTRRRRQRVLAVVSAVLVVSGCAPQAETVSPAPPWSREVGALVGLMVARLQIADDVAASKWVSKVPVENRTRERVVEEQARLAAIKIGADPATVGRVIAAQIEASKVVQRGLIATWSADPTEAPRSDADLAAGIRPRIDAVDAELIAAIKASQPLFGDPSCTGLVASALDEANPSIDALHRQALARALRGVCTT